MGVTVRELSNRDFFPWLGLYEDFAADRGVRLTDLIALQLWSWLTEEPRRERGLVAVDDDDVLLGLVHFREVPRPLRGDLAVQIDDFFVVADHRGQGTGRTLLNAVVAAAAEVSASTVQWLDTVNDDTSRGLSGQHGDAANAVLYELRHTEG
jgi:GNAT superfamily N-acetyltransferase